MLQRRDEVQIQRIAERVRLGLLGRISVDAAMVSHVSARAVFQQVGRCRRQREFADPPHAHWARAEMVALSGTRLRQQDHHLLEDSENPCACCLGLAAGLPSKSCRSCLTIRVLLEGWRIRSTSRASARARRRSRDSTAVEHVMLDWIENFERRIISYSRAAGRNLPWPAHLRIRVSPACASPPQPPRHARPRLALGFPRGGFCPLSD